MLFFFHVIEGECEIPDHEGTDLPSEEAAQTEAAAIAAELVREFPDRFHGGSVLEVFSEDRRRILALPFGRPNGHLWPRREEVR